MNEVSDFVSLGQYDLAMKRITIANVNRLNRHDESFLMVYSGSIGYRDAPEFIEHLFAVGYELKDDDYRAVAHCLGRNRYKSAKMLLTHRPDWFSEKTFEVMLRNEFGGGMCYFIEWGFPFKWYKPSLHAVTASFGLVSLFHFSRERARERAVALLGLPRLRRGTRVGITKDVAQIIARVIWELRKFN